MTGRRAVRVHREVQLAVDFAGQQLGVCLRVVAEDDANGAGVGREPAVGRREARAGEQVRVRGVCATGSLIPPS